MARKGWAVSFTMQVHDDLHKAGLAVLLKHDTSCRNSHELSVLPWASFLPWFLQYRILEEGKARSVFISERTGRGDYRIRDDTTLGGRSTSMTSTQMTSFVVLPNLFLALAQSSLIAVW